jgi:hypothetical protein
VASSRPRAILGAALIATAIGLARPAAAQEIAGAEGPPAAPQADAAAQTARMRSAMHLYFEGEKREAWAFGGAGVLTAGGGTALFFAKDDFYRGAAYPVVIVGVIQLAAGIVLLARTDAQVAALDARLDAGKRAFLDLEQPRMNKVRKEFSLLAGIELTLIVAGLGLATYGGAQRDHTLTGIGAGIALQSAAMLTFDMHASTRADAYSAAIGAFER